MNKTEFINYIAAEYNCTKVEAEKIINVFTKAVISALGAQQTIELISFGKFSTAKVVARTGRNPKNGEPLEIPAHIQAKFKVGQTLKDACNKKI